MERSRRLVMGALLVAMDVTQPTGEKIEKIPFAVPGVATPSPATGATPEKKER